MRQGSPRNGCYDHFEASATLACRSVSPQRSWQRTCFGIRRSRVRGPPAAPSTGHTVPVTTKRMTVLFTFPSPDAAKGSLPLGLVGCTGRLSACALLFLIDREVVTCLKKMVTKIWFPSISEQRMNKGKSKNLEVLLLDRPAAVGGP